MLFLDNLIIRLVFVYQLKKICILNKANHSSSISSSDIQLSSIYLQLRKEYKHIFHVFSRKQEFRLNTFARKTKVSSDKPLCEE